MSRYGYALSSLGQDDSSGTQRWGLFSYSHFLWWPIMIIVKVMLTLSQRSSRSSKIIWCQRKAFFSIVFVPKYLQSVDRLPRSTFRIIIRTWFVLIRVDETLSGLRAEAYSLCSPYVILSLDHSGIRNDGPDLASAYYLKLRGDGWCRWILQIYSVIQSLCLFEIGTWHTNFSSTGSARVSAPTVRSLRNVWET